MIHTLHGYDAAVEIARSCQDDEDEGWTYIVTAIYKADGEKLGRIQVYDADGILMGDLG